ncbi:LLM class flavin-dependent oxidoreductase [Bradyrhizobium sp. CCGB12]|uniref:LLM class flavin-dependent oxidoreductase n=1 Tax=Bradyrhizobium sp. CCGB12 TaxID=2949632 RepID=UPI0020B1B4B2|nr:LLM class flavin-dependent oxidoreductase [Bradyrhizobium sp. CCGB12]MCP3392286.1 LLM class flavin-dependent oxidoreductase [Bradyrhizobium sp. CCGB12]
MKISNFSLFTVPWGRRPPKPADMVAVAKHAEDLGFYSLTMAHTPLLPPVETRAQGSPIWSHLPKQFAHFEFDALVLLPMVCEATSRIKVGLNHAPLWLFHPFVWAKYLASLDAATDGRLIAAFSVGRADNADNLGIDRSKRSAMSDEALDIIIKLWTMDEPLTWTGEHYRGTELVVEPKPVQKPYPELWWAGWNDESVEQAALRAARYGRFLEDAVWPLPGNAADAIKTQFVPAVKSANQKLQRKSELCMMAYANVFDRDLQGEELSRRYWDWPQSVLDTVVAGSPERCAQVINNLQSAGVSHIVLDFQRHGFDHIRELHAQMELFITKVLPLIAD